MSAAPTTNAVPVGADVRAAGHGHAGLVKDVGAGTVGRQPGRIDNDVELVIIEGDATPLAVGNRGIDGAGLKVDEEGLIRLVPEFAVHCHGDGLATPPRRKVSEPLLVT